MRSARSGAILRRGRDQGYEVERARAALARRRRAPRRHGRGAVLPRPVPAPAQIRGGRAAAYFPVGHRIRHTREAPGMSRHLWAAGALIGQVVRTGYRADLDDCRAREYGPWHGFEFHAGPGLAFAPRLRSRCAVRLERWAPSPLSCCLPGPEAKLRPRLCAHDPAPRPPARRPRNAQPAERAFDACSSGC